MQKGHRVRALGMQTGKMAFEQMALPQLPVIKNSMAWNRVSLEAYNTKLDLIQRDTQALLSLGLSHTLEVTEMTRKVKGTWLPMSLLL